MSMVDLPIVFSVVGAILSIGFLGNIFFKKTGWPDILFLIAVGIVIGPFLNIFFQKMFSYNPYLRYQHSPF